MAPAVLLYDVGVAVIVPVVGILLADILGVLTINDATLLMVTGRTVG